MSPGHDFGAACLRLSRQQGGERHLHKTKKQTVPSDFWLEDSREGRLVLKPTCNLKRKPARRLSNSTRDSALERRIGC